MPASEFYAKHSECRLGGRADGFYMEVVPVIIPPRKVVDQDPAHKTCSSCGRQVEIGQRSCPNCGEDTWEDPAVFNG